MLEHIITASSRKGAIVLDSFSGSANTAKACLNTDRKYICIEKDLNYFQTSCDRVANHDPKALVTSKKAKKPRAIIEGQLALFVWNYLGSVWVSLDNISWNVYADL